MISTRIDLTANHDFGDGGSILFDPVIVFVDDDELMTSDKYEHLFRMERYFGRTRHYDGRLDVFSTDDVSFEMKMRSHCQRCGKEIRMPWNSVDGLCNDCTDIIFKHIQRIPWNSFTHGDTPIDLFNLR